jgi:hypothetical protein
MRMTVPSRTSFGDYVLESSWGIPYAHMVTFCEEDKCLNNTLTTVTPNRDLFLTLLQLNLGAFASLAIFL